MMKVARKIGTSAFRRTWLKQAKKMAKKKLKKEFKNIRDDIKGAIARTQILLSKLLLQCRSSKQMCRK